MGPTTSFWFPVNVLKSWARSLHCLVIFIPWTKSVVLTYSLTFLNSLHTFSRREEWGVPECTTKKRGGESAHGWALPMLLPLPLCMILSSRPVCPSPPDRQEGPRSPSQPFISALTTTSARNHICLSAEKEPQKLEWSRSQPGGGWGSGGKAGTSHAEDPALDL